MASDQDNKRGPKPKELETFEKQGIPVGRDNVHIDPEEVRKLSALGCSPTEIADFFGVNYSTLKRNFASEITKGTAEAKLSLRRAMLQNAQNMNASVQIFLAKNWLSMSDSPVSSEEKILPWVEEKHQPAPITATLKPSEFTQSKITKKPKMILTCKPE